MIDCRECSLSLSPAIKQWVIHTRWDEISYIDIDVFNLFDWMHAESDLYVYSQF